MPGPPETSVTEAAGALITRSCSAWIDETMSRIVWLRAWPSAAIRAPSPMTGSSSPFSLAVSSGRIRSSSTPRTLRPLERMTRRRTTRPGSFGVER